MEKSEYQELVEFLAVQFARVGERFAGVEDRLTGVEDRLTRVEILGEENRHLIQTVAEGVVGVNQKVDALRSEMDARFSEQQALFTSSHRDLEQRVTALEEGRGGG